MSDPRAIKALEYLDPVLEEMKSQIVSEVHRLITENELTPELALQKWHEFNSLHTLPKRVTRSVNRTRTAK